MPKANILIVEDNDLIALDLKAIVEGLGYNIVGVTATGEEAIGLAQALKPDVVLMDIALRGKMDGISAASHIADGLGLEVIYLTSHSEQATLERARITEPQAYIIKPVSEEQIKAALEMTLYKRQTSKAGRDPVFLQPPTSEHSAAHAKLTAYDFLSGIELFANVAAERLKALAATCRFQEVAARETIYLEGDPQIRPFVVVSGRIALSKASPDGRELIVEMLLPGDPSGLIAAVGRQTAWLTSRAQTASEILFVPKAPFVLLLDEDRELHRKFTQYAARRLNKSHELARAMAYDAVEPRIASVLLSLAERQLEASGGSDKCALQMTRQELAALAGNSLETTIRITKAMERDGVLALQRRGHIQILDLERLRDLAGQ